MTDIAIKIFDELQGNPFAWAFILVFMFLSFLPKVLSFISDWKEFRSNHHELQLRKLHLEIDKLNLEIESLRPRAAEEDIFIQYADRPMFSILRDKKAISRRQKAIYKPMTFVFALLSATCWIVFILVGLLFFWAPVELASIGKLSWGDGLSLQAAFIVVAIATYNGGKYFSSLREKYGATNT